MDKKEPSDSHVDRLYSAIMGEGYELSSHAIAQNFLKHSDNKISDIFIYVHTKSRIYGKCTFLNQTICAKGREIVTVFEGDDEYAC